MNPLLLILLMNSSGMRSLDLNQKLDKKEVKYFMIGYLSLFLPLMCLAGYFILSGPKALGFVSWIIAVSVSGFLSFIGGLIGLFKI